jgi:hypothetical protein
MCHWYFVAEPSGRRAAPRDHPVVVGPAIRPAGRCTAEHRSGAHVRLLDQTPTGVRSCARHGILEGTSSNAPTLTDSVSSDAPTGGGVTHPPAPGEETTLDSGVLARHCRSPTCTRVVVQAMPVGSSRTVPETHADAHGAPVEGATSSVVCKGLLHGREGLRGRGPAHRPCRSATCERVHCGGRPPRSEASAGGRGCVRSTRSSATSKSKSEPYASRITTSDKRTQQPGRRLACLSRARRGGSMARARAVQGRKISARKTRALRSFADVYADIDRIVRSLDHEKVKLTDEIARRRVTPKTVALTQPTAGPSSEPHAQESADGPPAHAQSLPPPTWAPDPLHRHELRYWDGAAWTEHVADQGLTSVDPL